MSNANVATKINDLLARVANIKRASELNSTTFSAKAQRRAEQIARKDAR